MGTRIRRKVKMKIPYVTFGGNELKNQPVMTDGMEIICPQCGLLHKIKFGRNVKTGEKTNDIACYSCNQTGKTYLAGLGGRLIIGMKKK